MKSRKTPNLSLPARSGRSPGRVLLLLMTLIPLSACDVPLVGVAESRPNAVSLSPGRGEPGTVLVTSTGMNLQAPEEISSGWTTFRYENRSNATHFFVLERMPEGRTVEDSRREVVPVFDAAMKLIMEGDPAAGFAQFANLPAWYGDVMFVGGPGLVAPGNTGLTTVRLDPGTYVIECYVKAPDGTFHTSMGMIEGLTVTDESSGGREPRADFAVTISDAGIELSGDPKPGMRTFSVHFAQQTVQPHGLGYDVHLVRLERDTDLTALGAWMNWSVPSGLTTPAPAEFLGGSQEMPAGSTAYVTALLTPGRYALVAEIPDPAAKNMLRTFSVPDGHGGKR